MKKMCDYKAVSDHVSDVLAHFPVNMNRYNLCNGGQGLCLACLHHHDTVVFGRHAHSLLMLRLLAHSSVDNQVLTNKHFIYLSLDKLCC